MQVPADPQRRGALARDAATRRLRRTTQLSVAAMAALGGTFAALAAGSTHPKKVVTHVAATRKPSASVLVDAPVPPLVGAQSEAPPPSAAPAPPAAAPAPSYQPPVVVSGGS